MPTEVLEETDRSSDRDYVVRLSVLDAFVRNPRLGWTPTSLSLWYGIRIDLVRVLVDELAARGVVRADAGPGERFVLAA